MFSGKKTVSQYEIEEELLRLTQLLEEETEAFAVLAEDEAKKSARLKGNWAKEYLAAKGSIKERESWADYVLTEANFDAKVAEALVKAKREKLMSIRTSLDSLRTLAANVRAQT